MMLLNLTTLSGGTSGTGGTSSVINGLSRPTQEIGQGDKVGQCIELSHLSHHHQNTVGREKPFIINAVPRVPPVPPKKHNNRSKTEKSAPIPRLDTEKQSAAFPSVTPKDPETIEERAAILEFEAGLSREVAEQIAAGVAFRWWEVHFLDQAPHLICCAPPATYEQVLGSWPETVAAVPHLDRHEDPQGCMSCKHHRRPGKFDSGACGSGRADLEPHYGPRHSLKALPSDLGCIYEQREAVK